MHHYSVCYARIRLVAVVVLHFPACESNRLDPSMNRVPYQPNLNVSDDATMKMMHFQDVSPLRSPVAFAIFWHALVLSHVEPLLFPKNNKRIL